jgi:hypothetical protein
METKLDDETGSLPNSPLRGRDPRDALAVNALRVRISGTTLLRAHQLIA